ncbi:hypothetical protein AB9F39_39215, partial [Rhizobium leguminosarum]
RGLLLILVICTQLFPYVILITPLYSIFFAVGLINNPLSLVLSYTSMNLPFAVELGCLVEILGNCVEVAEKQIDGEW